MYKAKFLNSKSFSFVRPYVFLRAAGAAFSRRVLNRYMKPRQPIVYDPGQDVLRSFFIRKNPVFLMHFIKYKFKINERLCDIDSKVW